MSLQILSDGLLKQYKSRFEGKLDAILDHLEKQETPVDAFRFYNSVSTVYSGKIEGEDIDYDRYFKHKFLHVQYQPDYTKRSDDLFMAYEFITENLLSLQNLKKAHRLLSANLLPPSQQGAVRTNPMFVINSLEHIEYVAANPAIVKDELEKLFADIDYLSNTGLSTEEVFYFASYMHLVFIKIHPFQDGNGRSARLLEKWFLLQKLGGKAAAIPLEKQYFLHRDNYYNHLRALGLEYACLDYSRALGFLLMTAGGLAKEGRANSFALPSFAATIAAQSSECPEYCPVDRSGTQNTARCRPIR